MWARARGRLAIVVYRSLVGSGTRLCALTVDGRVECDREWPFLKP
jgi:hypothetical protein